jgi:hypothetical protein
MIGGYGDWAIITYLDPFAKVVDGLIGLLYVLRDCPLTKEGVHTTLGLPPRHTFMNSGEEAVSDDKNTAWR